MGNPIHFCQLAGETKLITLCNMMGQDSFYPAMGGILTAFATGHSVLSHSTSSYYFRYSTFKSLVTCSKCQENLIGDTSRV